MSFPPFIFAEATVDPTFGWNSILLVALAAGIGAAIVTIINGLKAQKRDVKMMEEFATRRELQDLAMRVETKFEALRHEIREDKNEMMSAGEDRAVKLHERINKVLSAVSHLQGQLHSREET